MLSLLLLLVGSSCEKDSDLFAEMIAQNEAEQLIEDQEAAEEEAAEEEAAEEETPVEEEPTDFVNYDDGPLKSFPAAYGGGSSANGWRNNPILIVVNTLNVSSPLNSIRDRVYEGGLYAALGYDAPKIIVFNVSGIIDQGNGGTQSFFGNNGITSADNTLILGQTAPKGGITLTNGTFRFDEPSNLAIRYIRSRPIKNKNGLVDVEDDANTVAIMFHGGDNSIIDHCSVSFAQDKAIILSKHYVPIQNMTVQRTLIADSHTMVAIGHNPGKDPNTSNNISFTYNLLGNSAHRTPNMHFTGYGEIINNVVHGWGSRLGNSYFGLKLNHLGNYYKSPVAVSTTYQVYQNVGEVAYPTIYTSKNFYPELGLTGQENEDNTIMWRDFFDLSAKLSSTYYTNTMHPRSVSNPCEILSPKIAYDNILSDVGANKFITNDGEVEFYVDDYDSSVINNVVNNIRVAPKQVSNWKLPNLPENTRPSNYDTDNDGMADAWEIRKFGDLSRDFNGDEDGDGYLNIEEFANQVDF